MSFCRKIRKDRKRQALANLSNNSTEFKHPVHGYFVYQCETCGVIYKMYLDKGLEDRIQDAVSPEEHKPVPFVIKCRECNDGMCKHILWNLGGSDAYSELPEGANYFKNIVDEECGRPVIFKPDARNIQHFMTKEIYGGEIGGN